MNKKELAKLALRERRAGRNPNRVLAAAVNDIGPAKFDAGEIAGPAPKGWDWDKYSAWYKDVYDTVSGTPEAFQSLIDRGNALLDGAPYNYSISIGGFIRHLEAELMKAGGGV